VTVRIEPWTEDDLPLVQALVGDPVMMEHLGGPEDPGNGPSNAICRKFPQGCRSPSDDWVHDLPAAPAPETQGGVR
jgi:hypothetical protein